MYFEEDEEDFVLVFVLEIVEEVSFGSIVTVLRPTEETLYSMFLIFIVSPFATE